MTHIYQYYCFSMFLWILNCKLYVMNIFGTIENGCDHKSNRFVELYMNFNRAYLTKEKVMLNR